MLFDGAEDGGWGLVCQLGHTELGVTSIYLQMTDNTEIINAVHSRQPPMMPANAGPQL